MCGTIDYMAPEVVEKGLETTGLSLVVLGTKCESGSFAILVFVRELH